MKQLTAIYLDDKSYDSMIFSMDSDYVSTFNEDEESDETFVPADKVLLVLNEELVSAADFIRSLTDEELSQITCFTEDDELTYLVSIKGKGGTSLCSVCYS